MRVYMHVMCSWRMPSWVACALLVTIVFSPWREWAHGARWNGSGGSMSHKSMLVHGWEYSADRRSIPGAQVLDLQRSPPRWGMQAETFFDALRSLGSLFAMRGFRVPNTHAGESVQQHGTFLFEHGVVSARPESQADVCLRACQVFNALGSGEASSGVRCEGVTVAPILEMGQLHHEGLFGSFDVFVADGTCVTPVPRTASCWLLRGVGAEDVDVLYTAAHMQVSNAKCIISSLLTEEAAWSCPAGRGVEQQWAPMFSDSGDPLVATAADGHGNACLCAPGWAGARCSMSTVVECASPSTFPLVEDHCTPLSGVQLHDGVTYTGRVCGASFGAFECRRCIDMSKHGSRCQYDKCTQDDGSPLCHDRAFRCVEGACQCPVGWDPTTGCRACMPGFSQGHDASTCVPNAQCWSVANAAEHRSAWFEEGGHGGRGMVCNGHGTCAGDTNTCMCDAGWGGGMCTTAYALCGDPSMVSPRRTNVVGSCMVDSFERDFSTGSSGVCGLGGRHGGGNTTFLVTAPYARDQAWKVCAMLNAVLESGEPGWGVCAWGFDVQAGSTNQVEALAHGYVVDAPAAGANCAWSLSGAYRYTRETPFDGIPVMCRGYQCSPDLARRAMWAELVPTQGVPSVSSALSMCHVTASLSSSQVATNVDIAAEADAQRMFDLSFHVPSLEGWPVIQQIVWYRDIGSDELSFAHWTMLRGEDGVMRRSGGGITTTPASGYTRFVSAILGEAEDVRGYVACVLEDVFIPGQHKKGGSEGSVSMLLWL